MIYLPIEKTNLRKKPYQFKITILQETYTFKIYYNQSEEYFSFDLYDKDNELLVAGRKIVVNVNMMKNITDTFEIIPLSIDLQALEKGITFDNFMNNIKPYIFEGGF